MSNADRVSSPEDAELSAKEPVTEQVDDLLQEVRQFCDELLPEAFAKDTKLAVELYVTMHPLMRDKLYALHALETGQSAEVTIGKDEADGPAGKRRWGA